MGHMHQLPLYISLHAICLAPEVSERRCRCLERTFCCDRWDEVDIVVCCYSHWQARAPYYIVFDALSESCVL